MKSRNIVTAWANDTSSSNTTWVSPFTNQTSTSQATIWDTVIDSRTFVVRSAQDHMMNVVLRNVKRNAPTATPTRITPMISAGQISTNVFRDDVSVQSSVRDVILRDGTETTIKLPDGSRLEVKKDGSFELIDTDAKVTYRACRVRNFNPFLNASDKLEAFIRFCGTVGVRQSEVLRLPLELFVAWLVIEAARADGEAEPDLPLVPRLKERVSPRCSACGRFLSLLKRQRKIDFCAPKCFERHFNKALVAHA